MAAYYGVRMRGFDQDVVEEQAHHAAARRTLRVVLFLVVLVVVGVTFAVVAIAWSGPQGCGGG